MARAFASPNLLTDATALAGEALAVVRSAVAGLARAVSANRVDVLIGAAIALPAAAFAVWRFYQFDYLVFGTVWDLWFGGDVPRIIETNTGAWSTSHGRVSVHPLLSLLVCLPLIVLGKFHVGGHGTSVVMVAVGSFCVTAVFYAAARLIGLRRLDAALACGLLVSTAAAMFWMPAPETFTLGGATILFSLAWLASPRSSSDAWSGPLQSALSLSITITNWMAGLLATVLALRLRKAITVTLIAVSAVLMLGIVQEYIFKTSGKPFDIFPEQSNVETGGATIIEKAMAFPGHAFLAPDTLLMENKVEGRSIQFATPTVQPKSWLVWADIAGWAVLFLLALEALLRRRVPAKPAIFVLTLIPIQLLLHMVYGDGPFLYSMHFTPLLVMVAAWSCLGPRRPLALALIALTAAGSGAYNLKQFQTTMELVRSYPEGEPAMKARTGEHGVMLLAMHQRPNDPWPSGAGHIVWGSPGAPFREKAYLEPGGSLSPRPGGPGVSIWVYGQDGALATTSDQEVAPAATQRFERVEGDALPSVVFDTPAYTARWRQPSPNRWLVTAAPKGQGRSLALTLRGVGPAAGPVHDLAFDQSGALTADSCWTAKVAQGTPSFLGEEGGKAWLKAAKVALPSSHSSETGWAAARIVVPAGATLEAEIDQTCAPGSPPKWPMTGGVRVEPANLPIARLLDSQSAHLLMGFEGNQTRPGDPISYQLQWLRDGAYSVVAMARAGRIDVARELVMPFAENDFFGGFGAEADAPGESLWAIYEVARAADDAALDQTLWPHVRRKADFILQLQNTQQQVRRPFVGPLTVVDKDNDLVADAAKDGLINGRMDWHRPVLFVNGFAWRGLEDAASFADRVKQPAEARKWRAAAAELRKAWSKQFAAEGLLNERTTASLLWPTGVAGQDLAQARKLIDATPAGFEAKPLWTYFDVARAHQFLRLGEVDRAWKLADDLNRLSPMPGLDVLWEGGEEPRKGWESYRGWKYIPTTMPHYWAAAELMLFAEEGLAYLDDTAGAPTLVIGAGVKPEWLKQPVSVTGVGTRAGPVDWRWDGHAATVALADPSLPVKLGPSFPAGTPIVRVTRK